MYYSYNTGWRITNLLLVFLYRGFLHVGSRHNILYNTVYAWMMLTYKPTLQIKYWSRITFSIHVEPNRGYYARSWQNWYICSCNIGVASVEYIALWEEGTAQSLKNLLFVCSLCNMRWSANLRNFWVNRSAMTVTTKTIPSKRPPKTICCIPSGLVV